MCLCPANKNIQENVAEAANIMQKDGSHPELVYGHQDTMIDNLTDSIMLLTARHEGTESIFEEALLINRISVNGMMDSEILAAEASGEKLAGDVTSYGRYWHGYLLYVKPLLMVFNYGQIRYLISGIQFALLASVLYLFVKKQKENHVIPFMSAYLFLNPATLTLSLQYFPASVLTMLQFVIILLNEEKYVKSYVRWIYHFIIVGCLTAYFDFLTYPLLTLGMPLAYLLIENGNSVKTDIKAFTLSCSAWAIGYVGMWGSKWILGTLFTEENIIADAFKRVLHRVGATENDGSINALQVIFKNIGANKVSLLLIVIVFVCVIIYYIFKKRTLCIKNINIGVLLCVLLPIMWYVVVSNHSYIHYWFTYRILAISIYACFILTLKLLEER